jgi:ketosteroid isomerase-like protein
MRRAALPWWTAICLCLTACQTQSGTTVDTAAEKAAVRQRSEALVAVENAKQFDQAVTFWADDAIIHQPFSPPVQGRAAIKKAYDDFAGMGMEGLQGTIKEIVVAASGDLAYELGENRITMRTPTGPMVDVGKYLAVWKKVGADWMIAALAVSSDAPPPAAGAPGPPPPTSTR